MFEGIAFTPMCMLATFCGTALGIIFGVLPGLTATMGIALLIPLTFNFEPVVAISAMLGVYVGGVYSGAITAILISTPGTAVAAATLLEGPKLTRKGLAGKALSMTTIASFIGGIFSCIVLILIAPQLATAALSFGPPEFFALAFFGLAVVAGISSGSLLKGLLATLLGMFLATIGQDPISGTIRSTFGVLGLLSGIAVVPALIGLFAIPTVLERFEEYLHGKTRVDVSDVSGSFVAFKDVWRNAWNLIRSSFLGTFIGIIPGTGSGIAAFVAYNKAKQASNTPEKFGTGHLEGIAATESANNAVTGGALVPLLTLSIPGDVITAVLFGGLMLQGVVPGPLLFRDNPEMVQGIFTSLILANCFMLILGLSSAKIFAKILKVPNKILMPMVVMFCVGGAFSINNSHFDVVVMGVFGLLGYGMNKAGFPSAPLLLGLIISPIAEMNFRRAMVISDSDLTIFFTQPISLVLILLALLSIAKNIHQELTMRKKQETGG